MRSGFIALCLFAVLGCTSTPQPISTDMIRLNQIGFYPDALKAAVVINTIGADAFHIVDQGTQDTVYTGRLGPTRTWAQSGEAVRRADFSMVQTPGRYVVAVEGIGASHPFQIADAVHRTVATAALKGFYYQRVSQALPEALAGAWARPAGHPDDAVLVHASAATAARPEGTQITASRGWYDAGDYNKYIVNSGISTYALLLLYEQYPDFADAWTTAIPESDNALPDVLDEVLWNLRWMLTMQDPNDGGVYHKLTTAHFSGAVMPHEATETRYVVQKGTAAALNFAAVTAQAARVFAAFPETTLGLADSLRMAALGAWEWARAHPDVVYDQQALSDQHQPPIETGAYGNNDLVGAFAWAAAELAVTTQVDSFLTVANPLDLALHTPAWSQTGPLGWYTLLSHPSAFETPEDPLATRFLAYADSLVEGREHVPYQTVMGAHDSHFVWGSNAVAANQGMLLMQAFRLSADSTYLWAALSNLDYILGRNATGFSFVTGHGSQTPMHIHHRPSEADGIEAPVPGLVAGGPNPGQQDKCSGYPSNRPARSYIDDWCSYASNEIAINWNAPFVYLAAAIEATLATN